MKKLIGKSITIIVALVLTALCVSAAFGLYNVNATGKVVNISAAIPDPDVCHVLGWDGWSAANSNKMIYSAGTYTFNDKAFDAGDKFKVYNATEDSWDDTVASCTPPYTRDGENNIVLTKAGQYDISYVPATGITVTADSYDYTFTMSHSGVSGSGAHIKAWVWVDGSDGSWADVTTVSDTVYTASFPAAINRCQIVRLDDSGTISWDNKWNQTGTIDLSSSSSFTTSMW